MAKKNIDLLNPNASSSKIVFTLAWPIIVGQILQTIGQYINVAMIGSLGAVATASVSINSSVINMMFGVMSAIATGFSILVAQHIGAGENDEAKRVVRQAFAMILIVGFMFTVLMEALSGALPRILGAAENVIPGAVIYTRIVSAGYIFQMTMVVCSMILQCSGDTKTPTVYSAAAIAIQVLCNNLLIFSQRTVNLFGCSFTFCGAGLGVAGAGMSLVISQCVSSFCLLGTLFLKNTPIKLSIRGNYRPDKPILSSMSKLAIPTMFERLTLSAAYIVITPLVAEIGTAALAANSLASTAESMCYLPCLGFSVAATTLVAQSIGAGKHKLADRYIKLCSLYAVIIMFIAGVLMFIFSRQLMCIFTRDEEVIRMGSAVLRIQAFAEPFFALATVLSGAFRGMGDARWPFYISAVGMWGVRITVAYVMVKCFGFGLTAAWIGMMLDWIVRGSLCILRIYRSRSTFMNRGYV